MQLEILITKVMDEDNQIKEFGVDLYGIGNAGEYGEYADSHLFHSLISMGDAVIFYVFYSHMLDPRTIKHLYSKEYTLCAQAHTLPTSNPVQQTLVHYIISL